MIKRSKILTVFRTAFIKFKYKNKKVIFGSNCKVSIKCDFEGNNRIADGCTVIGEIGYGSYIGANSNIDACIGRYSCIGPNVYTIRGKHPTKQIVSMHPAFYSTKAQSGFTYVNEDVFEELDKPAQIGNDIWIGANTLILGNVKIGDGAIVAAGSVVTKDVSPYSVVGGVPAKFIRNRFSDDEIQELLKIKWWDWDIKTIQARASDFSDIQLFVSKYKDK